LLKGEIVVSWREFFEESVFVWEGRFMLMSEVVAPRRGFIKENALLVSNLDV
jgi:hypothetical protein